MKAIIGSLFVLCCLLVSCKPDAPLPTGDVFIRIHNVSEKNYKNVVVKPLGGSHHYGKIKAGAYTDYVPFEVAHRYAYVELNIKLKTYEIQPIDFFEPQLPAGKYTYAINFDEENGLLSIELE